MKQAILLFVCILFFQLGKAQKIDTNSLKAKLVLTEKQNIAWLDSLRKLPQEAQLSFILNRKMLDTNVVIRKFSYAHRANLQQIQLAKDKYEACCSPLIIFDLNQKKHWLVLDESTPTILLENLDRIKSKIILNQVHIYRDAGATALYGSRGIGGVVILEILDQKSKQLLKKISKE